MQLDIVSDVICPWCYIGKRQLDARSARWNRKACASPSTGTRSSSIRTCRKKACRATAYRAAKFGGAERAAEIDARVTSAAAQVGLEFNLDRIVRTPNTMEGHRLIWFAGRQGAQDAVVERLFAAYFTEGKDVGDHTVLADCAAEAGLDRAEVIRFLEGDVAAAELAQADRAAREAGVNGVPSFFLDGYGLFSGAVPAEQMAEALRRAQAILRDRAA